MSSTSPVVLMLGLNKAGKTKILYTLKLGKVVHNDMREIEFKPTTAFNFEVVQWLYKKVQFDLKIWDLSGDPKVRSMWKYFYQTNPPPDAIVFVVDDGEEGRSRKEEARKAFQQVLHDPNLIDAIKVVIVNIRDEDVDQTNSTDAIKRVSNDLGLNESSRVHGAAYITAIHLGKSKNDVDVGIFDAMNYICGRYLQKRNPVEKSLNV